MNRVWTAVTLLAAIAVSIAAGYVITHNDRVPAAGQVPGYSQSPITPTPTSTSTPTPSTSPTRARPTSRPTTVAFLGDDYTTGDGATAQAARFSTLISATLHLTERNFGSAGSGYAVSGAGGNYLSRIDEVVAAHPDVVLVSGGRNDVNGDAGTVASNAGTLFTGLHSRLPHAVLIAVAPFWGDSPPQRALAPIAASIKAAVGAAGGSYLAISDPLLGHPDWMANPADPNNAGYAAIAAAIKAPLGALIPRH